MLLVLVLLVLFVFVFLFRGTCISKRRKRRR